jgi:DNA-binding transcriptional MerR regulator
MVEEIEESYSTGDLAKYANAHYRTVINYVRLGLLGEVRRNERDHRRFTAEQRELFKEIFTRRNK